MPFHLVKPAGPQPTSGGGTSPPIGMTRRTFLALCAAGCVKSTPPEQPVDDAWALLADTHIQADPRKSAWDTCMAENLAEALAEVSKLAPQHVLFNGDMAFRADDPEDYAQFMKLLEPLSEPGQLLHFTLGNHDHRARFLAAVGTTRDQTLESKVVSSMVGRHAHYLLLDSLEKVNAITGSLGRAQRSWLTSRLNAYPALPAIVLLHHNPEVSLSGLADTPAFLEIIRTHRQVKAVIFGHTHEFRITSLDGVHFINLPAIGYRFKAHEPLGWIESHFRSSGARIELHCLTGRNSECGSRRKLDWRRDRTA